MQRTSDRLYWQLRGLLSSGVISPGKRISINELMKMLNAGRSPVRDAVKRLAAAGLLQTVPKSGVVVREITPEELREVFELREAIEPYAAAMAAIRMDDEHLRQLRGTCRKMRELAPLIRDAGFKNEELNQEMQFADGLFHQLILEAAGNQLMKKIVDDWFLLLRKVSYPSLRNIRHLSLTLKQHWRTYQALSRRDADAAGECMLSHVRHSKNASINCLRNSLAELTALTGWCTRSPGAVAAGPLPG